jgi:hypothetical protein
MRAQLRPELPQSTRPTGTCAGLGTGLLQGRRDALNEDLALREGRQVEPGYREIDPGHRAADREVGLPSGPTGDEEDLHAARLGEDQRAAAKDHRVAAALATARSTDPHGKSVRAAGPPLRVRLDARWCNEPTES